MCVCVCVRVCMINNIYRLQATYFVKEDQHRCVLTPPDAGPATCALLGVGPCSLYSCDFKKNFEVHT